MSDYMPYTAEHYIRRCESCPEKEGFCARIAADECDTYYLGEEVGLGHLTVLARSGRSEDRSQFTQPASPMAEVVVEKIGVKPEYL
jgi:hypothetical protein